MSSRDGLAVRARYALVALLIFGIEVGIALGFRDAVIRPFVGDALVVVLLYALAQAAIPRPPRRVALEVMLFAFTIEALQAVDYAAWLGGDRYPLLSVLLGRTFAWGDFLAYAAGAALTLLDPIAAPESGVARHPS